MEKELLFQYEFVRRSGETNMMDRKAVGVLADKCGLHQLAFATGSQKTYVGILEEYEQPNEEEYQDWLALHNALEEDNVDPDDYEDDYDYDLDLDEDDEDEE